MLMGIRAKVPEHVFLRRAESGGGRQLFGWLELFTGAAVRLRLLDAAAEASMQLSNPI